MKDAIIEVLEGAEPVDALNALFAVCYAVAAENGISEFNLESMFASNIEAYFTINAIVGEEDTEESEKDEQTDN